MRQDAITALSLALDELHGILVRSLPVGAALDAAGIRIVERLTYVGRGMHPAWGCACACACACA